MTDFEFGNSWFFNLNYNMFVTLDAFGLVLPSLLDSSF